jgi:hypothetical protein
MSTSSAEGPAGEPALTIVIGSNGAAGSVEACLDALARQVEGRHVEVLVCEPAETSDDVRRRHPEATFVAFPGLHVPHLWREGIDRARAPIVALTISPMRPAPDWVETILARHERDDVVAGAIEPGSGLRLADWAEYFSRYANDMLPFAEHESRDLPGDNAAYKRQQLLDTRDLWSNGFWEPIVHDRLLAEGDRLVHTPELVVSMSRSAGAGAFVHQRLVHGRGHGVTRGRGFGRGRNVVGILASPVVPVLLSVRTLRTVFSRGRLRGRVVLSLPYLLLFDVAWAIGEARGHLDVLRGR